MNRFWTKTRVIPVGGLLAVGFGRNSDLLLIVSASGRSVVDLASGGRVARDRDASLDWLDNAHCRCAGIGPLEGREVAVAGLWGGGLPTGPFDGCAWTLDLHSETGTIVLKQSGGQVLGPNDQIPDVFSDATLRAAGFSPTGLHLVLATSSDVTVYRQNRA